jgi:long-subunit acyl-CoA synthetase (AMP-forming)
MPGGWFRTGDLATVNEWGYISVVDRKKDMVGAENRVYAKMGPLRPEEKKLDLKTWGGPQWWSMGGPCQRAG